MCVCLQGKVFVCFWGLPFGLVFFVCFLLGGSVVLIFSPIQLTLIHEYFAVSISNDARTVSTLGAESSPSSTNSTAKQAFY